MRTENCPGSGTILPRDADTRFGNTICPECNAIANVFREGAKEVIDTHTVAVILGDGDDYWMDQRHDDEMARQERERDDTLVNSDGDHIATIDSNGNVIPDAPDVMVGGDAEANLDREVAAQEGEDLSGEGVEYITLEPDWEGMRAYVLHMYKTDPDAARKLNDAMGREAATLPAS